jgi:hypothetical protein
VRKLIFSPSSFSKKEVFPTNKYLAGLDVHAQMLMWVTNELNYLLTPWIKVLLEKITGLKLVNRPLGRSRRRWKYNIKMDLQGCGGMEWIELAQDRDR